MVNLNEVIIHASRKGEVGVLKELIDLNVDVNTKDEKGHTPLIIACYNQKADAAAFLLDAGADVDAQDHGGNTALMGAAFKGYIEIAGLLIRRGANLDLQHGNGGTALMFAAMFGRNDVLRLLLAHGADKYITDTRGLLAIDLAQQQNNQEGALLLQQVYPDILRSLIFYTLKQSIQPIQRHITEHAQVPLVSKEARVAGEVSLSKEVEERNETISNTVRHTEVDIEDIAGKRTRSPNTDKNGAGL